MTALGTLGHLVEPSAKVEKIWARLSQKEASQQRFWAGQPRDQPNNSVKAGCKMFFGAVVTKDCPWKVPVPLKITSIVYVKGHYHAHHTLAIRRKRSDGSVVPDIAVCRLHNPQERPEQIKPHFQVDVRIGTKDLEAELEIVTISDTPDWARERINPFGAEWHVSGYTLPRPSKQAKGSKAAEQGSAAARQE